MASADRDPGDRLNDHLDALARGETPRDLDPATTEAVRRFFARDDAPAPPRDLANQIWEDVMNQTAVAGTLPLRPTVDVPPALNGRTQAHPWRYDRLPPSAARRRWSQGLAQIASAALLLVTLGLGYLAFESLRPGSDRPSSIPAAVAPAATPGTPAATAAASIPRAGHPIVGAWQWDYDLCAPGANTNYAVFDADGSYIEYDDFAGVRIGTWRATGERTAELVTVVQHPVSLEFMFEPDYALPPSTLAGNVVTTWQAIEIDATENRLTSAGYYEPRKADGSIIVHLEYGDECTYELVATRMVVDPTAPEVTPAT